MIGRIATAALIIAVSAGSALAGGPQGGGGGGANANGGNGNGNGNGILNGNFNGNGGFAISIGQKKPPHGGGGGCLSQCGGSTKK
jgi:hypothetical protein